MKNPINPGVFIGVVVVVVLLAGLFAYKMLGSGQHETLNTPKPTEDQQTQYRMWLQSHKGSPQMPPAH